VQCYVVNVLCDLICCWCHFLVSKVLVI